MSAAGDAHPGVPATLGFDHLHVQVADRAAAQAWYARVLGLRPVAALAHWAQGGGPLVLADAGGGVHLALFERAPAPGERPLLALRVDAAGFTDWRRHLERELGAAPAFEDHGEALSLYFADPDGNGYEITCYEVDAALRAA